MDLMRDWVSADTLCATLTPVLDTVSSDHSFSRFLRGTREELEAMGGGAKSSERPSYGMITTSSSSSSSSRAAPAADGLGTLAVLGDVPFRLLLLPFLGDLSSPPDSAVTWGPSSRNTVGARFLVPPELFSSAFTAFVSLLTLLMNYILSIYVCVNGYVCEGMCCVCSRCVVRFFFFIFKTQLRYEKRVGFLIS